LEKQKEELEKEDDSFLKNLSKEFSDSDEDDGDDAEEDDKDEGKKDEASNDKRHFDNIEPKINDPKASKEATNDHNDKNKETLITKLKSPIE